jgi:glycerol-3-phosphate dehydrogenase
MNEGVDCVVIGAGVVGLAIGRSLALAGREVLIVERNAGIGEETSARNSEVVHAGIYYSSGSLKASLCVRGKSLLYAYCEARQIPFSRCGEEKSDAWMGGGHFANDNRKRSHQDSSNQVNQRTIVSHRRATIRRAQLARKHDIHSVG